MSDTSIAMWGPTGAGKTSILYAFYDVIMKKYQKSTKFDYILKNFKGENIDIKTPKQVHPTAPVGLQGAVVWVFYRVPKEPLGRTLQVDIAVQQHKLDIIDAAGGTLLEIVNGVRDARHQAVFNRLERSKHVIILLDPTLLKDGLLPRPEEEDVEQFTREEYVEIVTKLYKLLKSEERHFAICLTKADLLAGDDVVRDAQLSQDPKKCWNIIKDYFGQEVVNLWYGEKRVRPFVISSQDETNVTEWQPKGTEAPLFWLFEKTEEHRIAQSMDKAKQFSKWLFLEKRKKEIKKQKYNILSE